MFVHFRQACSCLVFVALLCSSVSANNVLMMISDNQTWHDAGCYGNDVVKTPNLDRLAAEGVRFRQAFATTASCGPSRAVIYSGLLTHSNGQYAHPHAEHNQQIRPTVTTVFERLKKNGYRTGLIGKDHIKPMEKYPIDFKPKGSSRDVVWTAKRAAEFMNDGDEPFFLVLSYSDPHPTSRDGIGWGAVREYPGYQTLKYNPDDIKVPGFLPNTADVRESIAGYYQQISRMDHGVGLAMEALEKSGHADETLVIFISDHGTSEPGAMGTHYEPGVRVPFIVRTPGAKAGHVNEALVAFSDITPTILDWTGTEFKESEIHGRSFLPILNENDPQEWRSALLSHVGHDVFANYPMRTLRHPRYKLIWNVTWQAEYPLPIDTYERRLWDGIRKAGGSHLGPRTVEQFLNRPQLELYDLESDPWETKNLAEAPEHADRKAAMVKELVSRLEAQNDPWLRKYRPEILSQR